MYAVWLVPVIILVILFNGCESDDGNEFSFSVQIKKDNVIYYDDAMTIKNHPVISGSYLPNFTVNVSQGTHTIAANFKHPSTNQVKIGWFVYESSEMDHDEGLLTVGSSDNFYMEVNANAKVYLYTIEGLNDSCNDTVNIKVDNTDRISFVPSQHIIKPMSLSISLTGLGVPETAGLNYTVTNRSGIWIGIMEEIHIDDPRMRFIRPNDMGYSSRGGPLADTVKFNFFGLDL